MTANNPNKELLKAKLALCKMIDQFMYTTDIGGNEYFYNMFESAGEAAFDALGINEDMIEKQAFYKIFDELNNQWFILNTGEKCQYSYEHYYLEEKNSK